MKINTFSRKPYRDVKRCNMCGSAEMEHMKDVAAREWEPVVAFYRDRGEKNPFEELPESFSLMKCKKCELVFISPRIDDSVVNRFYDEYLSGKYCNYIHEYDPSFREKIYKKYFKEIKKYLKDILETENPLSIDIGCATGEFIKVLSENGFEGWGIEVSSIVGEEAGKKGKVLIGDVVEQLALTPDDSFQLATMIDSIEHFKDPFAMLKTLSKKMKRGGVVFIETPNVEAGLDEMSRHFYLFSEGTLGRVLSESGFEVVEIQTLNSQYNPGDSVSGQRFLRAVGVKK